MEDFFGAADFEDWPAACLSEDARIYQFAHGRSRAGVVDDQRHAASGLSVPIVGVDSRRSGVTHVGVFGVGSDTGDHEPVALIDAQALGESRMRSLEVAAGDDEGEGFVFAEDGFESGEGPVAAGGFRPVGSVAEGEPSLAGGFGWGQALALEVELLKRYRR